METRSLAHDLLRWAELIMTWLRVGPIQVADVFNFV
jgi:hypothetical protein